MQAKRPELYRRLKEVFGRVDVTNQGQDMISSTTQEGGYQRRKVTQYGETYRVNCPYCTDTRRRLCIPHMWGKFDDETKSLNLHFARCFNETGCMKDGGLPGGRADNLWSELYYGIEEKRDNIRLSRPDDIDAPDFVWPGSIRDLREPCAIEARQYLESRGFNINELLNLYKLNYCVQGIGKWEFCTGRIVIPIIRDGYSKCWQCRYVGTPPTKKVPKYVSFSNKSQYLYNYDYIRQNSYVVLVEGPTSSWRFGPDSTCVFGKSISPKQLELLSNWKHIVLMLDNTPDIAREGTLEKAVEALSTLKATTKHTVVTLPPGKDPGDMERAEIRELAFSALGKLRGY